MKTGAYALISLITFSDRNDVSWYEISSVFIQKHICITSETQVQIYIFLIMIHEIRWCISFLFFYKTGRWLPWIHIEMFRDDMLRNVETFGEWWYKYFFDICYRWMITYSRFKLSNKLRIIVCSKYFYINRDFIVIQSRN